jgi:hypothetical protein
LVWQGKRPVTSSILFRHGQRPFIIGLANRLAIVGMALLVEESRHESP